MNLTKAEQELHIWVLGDDPEVVRIDTTLQVWKRKLERLGFVPLTTDSHGGATFQIPIKNFGGFKRSRTVKSGPLSAAQLAAREKFRLSRPRKTA